MSEAEAEKVTHGGEDQVWSSPGHDARLASMLLVRTQLTLYVPSYNRIRQNDLPPFPLSSSLVTCL